MSNIECCCGVTIHVHKSSNAWVKHLRRNPGHYEIDGCDGVSKDVSEDLMKEHIFEEHSEEIISKAIQSHFQKHSKANQLSSLEESTGKGE